MSYYITLCIIYYRIRESSADIYAEPQDMELPTQSQPAHYENLDRNSNLSTVDDTYTCPTPPFDESAHVYSDLK